LFENSRSLRNCLGTYPTGVTVITTVAKDGHPRGFCANSFASVSLDPPIVLFCIANTAASHEVFTQTEGFAINVLSERQEHVARLFATRRADKFSSVEWIAGPAGYPILAGTIAWFDCKRMDVVSAGDHAVIFGRIQAFDHEVDTPLVFSHGQFTRPNWSPAEITRAAEGH